MTKQIYEFGNINFYSVKIKKPIWQNTFKVIGISISLYDNSLCYEVEINYLDDDISESRIFTNKNDSVNFINSFIDRRKIQMTRNVILLTRHQNKNVRIQAHTLTKGGNSNCQEFTKSLRHKNLFSGIPKGKIALIDILKNIDDITDIKTYAEFLFKEGNLK